MKNLIKKVLMYCTFFSVSFGLAQESGNQQKLEAIYQRWQSAAISSGGSGGSTWFRTDGWPPLAEAVKAIHSNKMAMVYFLCEKIASGTNSGAYMYFEVQLLEHIAEIDLFRAEDKPVARQDFAANMNKFVAQFREEWRAGVYKDPSKKIAQLCEERLGKQNDNEIKPQDLTAIRRYGIFGLPELARQIQKHNSKHAFAAYLIIAGQSDEYSDYIKHSDQQFSSVTDKINHVKKKFEEMKTHSGGEFDVMNKISAALAN